MPTHDPFEGQMLLSYELRDDPHQEHEEFVDDLADARRHLKGKADMVVWATLHNHHGEEVADQQVLL